MCRPPDRYKVSSVFLFSCFAMLCSPAASAPNILSESHRNNGTRDGSESSTACAAVHADSFEKYHINILKDCFGHTDPEKFAQAMRATHPRRACFGGVLPASTHHRLNSVDFHISLSFLVARGRVFNLEMEVWTAKRGKGYQ
jgi:hypothetical protein